MVRLPLELAIGQNAYKLFHIDKENIWEVFDSLEVNNKGMEGLVCDRGECGLE